MMTNLKWRFSGMLVLIVVLVSGCLKSDPPGPNTPKTYISLMHLAPTAPALDVYFNDNRVSNNAFTPGAATSGYNGVDHGFFTVKFKKAGADSLVTEIPQALYDSMSFYTLMIYNEQVDGPAKVLRIRDDFSGLATTKPYYRFFHASPNTDDVDLYIDNVKIETDRSHADNVGFALYNKFSEIISGHHTLEVRLAGTATVVATANIELIQGNAYTFYLKGLEGGTGNKQLTLSVLRAV